MVKGNSFVYRFSEWVVRYRLFIIIFTLIMTVLSVIPFKWSVIVNDPDDWVNPKHPYIKLNKQIKAEFGGANVLQVMVKAKNGDIFNPTTLAKIKSVSDQLTVMKGFIPPNFEAMTATKVKAFRADKDMVAIQQLMPDTPTTPERIAEIKQGVLTNPLTYGKLVSKDLKAALLMADFDGTTSVEEIYAAAQKIADKEEDENHSVRIAGKPVMMGWTNEQQWNEMPIAFMCLLVVCSLILLVSLKSRRGMILPVANGLLASIVGMSFVPLVGNVYNIISWGAPFIILVAAACHSVQFMRRYDEEYLKCKDIRTTIEKTISAMFNPLMISIITDSVGFAIILFTPFENLKPASWATSIGLLYVIWIILFWLPAVLSYSSPPGEVELKSIEEEERSSFSQSLGRLAVNAYDKWRLKGAIVLLLIAVIGVWYVFAKMYVGGVDWDNALYSNIAHRWENLKVYKDQMDISKTFAGAYPYNILIEGKKENVVMEPGLLKNLVALQGFLEKRPEITYTVSLPNYIIGMNILMHDGDVKYAHVPEDPKLNAQYLFLLSTGYPGEFETSVDTVTWKNTVIKCLVSGGSPKIQDKLVEDTKEWIKKNWTFSDAEPKVAGGFVGITVSMSEDTTRWLGPTFLILVAIIYVICGGLFRSWSIPIYLITPLTYGLCLLLGPLQYWTMSLKDTIDYGNMQFISLSLGTGVDSSVYLIARYLEEKRKGMSIQEALFKAWDTTGMSVIFSGTALVLAYVPLLFVKTYWAYLALGSAEILALNMIGSLVIMPFMFGIFKPRFLHGKEVRK